MRNAAGVEIVYVTERVQIAPDRFAIGWKPGIFHEPIAKHELARPRPIRTGPPLRPGDLLTQRRRVAGESRNGLYRELESRLGNTLPHTLDGDRMIVTPHNSHRTTPTEPMHLLVQRQSWKASGAFTDAGINCYVQDDLFVHVRVECVVCGVKRAFTARLWLDLSLHLGCHQCVVKEPDRVRQRRRWRLDPAKLPKTRGLFELVDTRGCDKHLEVFIRCTGPSCEHRGRWIRSSRWLNESGQSCLRCFNATQLVARRAANRAAARAAATQEPPTQMAGLFDSVLPETKESAK